LEAVGEREGGGRKNNPGGVKRSESHKNNRGKQGQPTHQEPPGTRKRPANSAKRNDPWGNLYSQAFIDGGGPEEDQGHHTKRVTIPSVEGPYNNQGGGDEILVIHSSAAGWED